MKKGISYLLLILILIGVGYLLYQHRTALKSRLSSYIKEIKERITKTENAGKKPAPEPGEIVSVCSDIDSSNTEDSLKEKIVLLDFWATWCPPCRQAIPYISEIYNDYKQRGVMVIGVSLDEDTVALKKFLEEEQIPYPIIIADDEIKEKFQIKAIPTLFLFDQHGEVALKEVGFTQKNIKEIRQKIEKLLRNKLVEDSPVENVGPVEINYFGKVITLKPISVSAFPQVSNPMKCYELDWHQVSDEFLNSIKTMFTKLKIEDCPFSQMLFLIELFSTFIQTEEEGCHSIYEILSRQVGNDLSGVIATSVVMQKLGWDVKFFYNENKAYLGVNLASGWLVRSSSWIEKGEVRYYLKEFDTTTPVGLKKNGKKDESFYCSGPKTIGLKPLPIIKNLPNFSGRIHQRELKWQYQETEYHIPIMIPFEQFHFAENFPVCLFGIVFSGCQELKNIGFIDTLKAITKKMDEYNQVNLLLKFCQSDDVFKYVAETPLKSVSWQLYEEKNDCDGRSVFLYTLLHSVLNYSFDDIVFVEWSTHMALALKPRTSGAKKILSNRGIRIDDYYILDPTYVGDTYWGDKMPHLSDKYEVIKCPHSLLGYIPESIEPGTEY